MQNLILVSNKHLRFPCLKYDLYIPILLGAFTYCVVFFQVDNGLFYCTIPIVYECIFSIFFASATRGKLSLCELCVSIPVSHGLIRHKDVMTSASLNM